MVFVLDKFRIQTIPNSYLKLLFPIHALMALFYNRPMKLHLYICKQIKEIRVTSFFQSQFLLCLCVEMYPGADGSFHECKRSLNFVYRSIHLLLEDSNMDNRCQGESRPCFNSKSLLSYIGACHLCMTYIVNRYI